MIPYTPEPWDLPPIEGSDVQLLPFGPVRGDVLESAQIVFYYIGEAILHCHPRLFFKHRGMEKQFEGLSPLLGVLIAERISGVDSVAHALAFCQAIEAAANARFRNVLDICAQSLRRWNVFTTTFIILAISVIPLRSRWARRRASCWPRNASS